ncbi:MAG: MFS transporter [Candidatus Sumerlaeia bacterium]
MTTIVVARKNGQIAIAADTMSSLGDTRQSADLVLNHNKILKVGTSYIGITGHCAHHDVMQHLFGNMKKIPEFDTPQSIFAFFRGLHQKLKDYYYINTEEEEDDEYESSQIMCMIANPHGIFGVYTFREVESYSKYYAFGSGYQFALGALHVAYDALDSAEEIAKLGVETAAKFDKGTGLPLTCYTLKEKARRRAGSGR